MNEFKIAWQAQMNYLLNNSGLPSKFRKPINLVKTKKDSEVYNYLVNVHSNVLKFVSESNNLVLMSSNVGNGKTSWAVKIMQRYMAEIAYGNGTRRAAYFISIPKLFADAGDFNYRATEEFKELLYNVKHADIVVFDELGAGSLTKANYQIIYDIVEYRLNNLKSSIYTTNYNDEQLIENLGERLYSRIVEVPDVLQFNGGSNRGKELNEIL